MKNLLKQFLDLTYNYLNSTKDVKKLPAPLRKYISWQKMMIWALPALYLITIPLFGFNLSLLGCVLLFELIAVFNYVDKSNTLVKGNYRIIEGKVEAVEEPDWMPATIRFIHKKTTTKNKRLLVKLPDNSYLRVYVGRKVENSFTPGMYIRIYSLPYIKEKGGVKEIHEYYTIASISNDFDNIQSTQSKPVNSETFEEIANKYVENDNT